MARRSDIQERWQYAKDTGARFFGVDSAFGLTATQIKLLTWIRWYEAIYALDDVRRPAQEIIEDDERLDAWWAEERRRAERELKDYYFMMRQRKPQTKEPPGARIIG